MIALSALPRQSGDKANQFLWSHDLRTCLYAARRIPEIADHLCWKLIERCAGVLAGSWDRSKMGCVGVKRWRGN